MFTRCFYLLGDNIRHSKSPEIYNFLFKKYSLEYNYSAFDISDKKFKAVFPELLNISNINGFNVTYPFKQNVIDYTITDQDVKNIGGANVIIRKENNFYSYNTDGDGFYNFFRRHKLRYGKIVIAGTGITGRSIAYSLKKNGVYDVCFLSRDPEAVNDLKFFEINGFKVLNYSETKNILCDFLVNATPVQIDKLKLNIYCNYDKIFDVNYSYQSNADYTGIELLIEQALINFEMFTGINVDNEYYNVKKFLLKVEKNGNA